jgi:nucleotide-binding universal stress UspA family protein
MRSKSSNKPDPAPHPNPSKEDFTQDKSRLPSSSRPVATFKLILVPIDFSDCSAAALDYALALAQKLESKIMLLHIVEPAAYPENYLLTPATLDEANQNLMAAGREKLATLEQKAKGHERSIETLVRMGRAQSEIPDTAKAIGADLIVLGTHGYSGPKHALLGGTAERVVRQAPCPVLTVRHAGSS